jgi:putative ABC transport system permease protein
VRLRRHIAPSARALFAHRLRAALALASVAAGVAAVLVTSALGEGARREVLRGIEAMGTNLLVVRPAQVKRLVSRKEIRGFVTSLRVEDSEETAALDLAREAAPAAEAGMRVKAGGGTMLAGVVGTSAAFPGVRNLRLRAGRFLDDEEDASARRVAVLGARVAETLFAGDDPIGQAIRIRGVPFEVVGVLEARGVLADGADEDAKLFIPIRTALRRVFNATWLSMVFVSVRDPTRMAEAERDIRGLLRERHRIRSGRPDDFAIQNRARLLAVQERMAWSLTLLSAGLAGISLLVGGSGILALMLSSVKERTAEIGLRMAVGATPRDVLVQFLSEATLLALGGWLGGAVAGGLGAAFLALGTEWKVAVPTLAVLASFGMAVVTGLGFGAVPARKAALLPPIRALATE